MKTSLFRVVLSCLCLAACVAETRSRDEDPAAGDDPGLETPAPDAATTVNDKKDAPRRDMDTAAGDGGTGGADASSASADTARHTPDSAPGEAAPADAGGPDLRTSDGGRDSGSSADGASSDSSTPGLPAAINTWRLEIPCSATMPTPSLCSGKMSIKSTKTLGGDPSKIYEVTFRVRGIVEPHIYLDSSKKLITMKTAAPFMVVNADPLVPQDVINASWMKQYYDSKGLVGVFNENNVMAVFAVEVPEPKATYHLNVYYALNNAHYLYKIDYTAKVTAKGGTILTLSYKDANNYFPANWQKHVIAGVAPDPKPYGGMLIQLDTMSVSEAK